MDKLHPIKPNQSYGFVEHTCPVDSSDLGENACYTEWKRQTQYNDSVNVHVHYNTIETQAMSIEQNHTKWIAVSLMVGMLIYVIYQIIKRK